MEMNTLWAKFLRKINVQPHNFQSFKHEEKPNVLKDV